VVRRIAVSVVSLVRKGTTAEGTTMARRRKITDQFPGSLRAALRRRGIRMVRPRAQKTRTSGAQLALVGVRGAGLTPFSVPGAKRG